MNSSHAPNDSFPSLKNPPLSTDTPTVSSKPQTSTPPAPSLPCSSKPTAPPSDNLLQHNPHRPGGPRRNPHLHPQHTTRIPLRRTQLQTIGKVISKHFSGSFKNTELHEHLQSIPEDQGKKIVLAGYMVHLCASTTARQGHELGYEVIVRGMRLGIAISPARRGRRLQG